ncbi:MULTISPECIES: response regulator transcription factor [Streptomyces]|nr:MULTISPECIES: LuxR C-terminal-related transcriptional regulator [unclassified Streptomyces]MDT0436594.1 LuxR C-terminal-related transcriptional regulator [Streptomyces sp. DSM 41981]MYQ63360.1 DNA-binding response regulator [Streptomyces sp. SID4950]SCD56627.1 DNA-binding response regulator, NarL/FixJ family, contains REC and HTH domains [Streptomyces sp. SolWspMP-5a-2]
MTLTLIPTHPAPATAPLPLPAATAVRVPVAPGADRVRAVARRAGLACVLETGVPGAVTVVVAADAEQALRAGQETGPLLLVCDTVTRTGLLHALRSGAVVLRAADLTEETLTAAVRRAAHPHPSIPYPELSHLLVAGARPGEPLPTGPRSAELTVRQASVLRLMADGYANADIARLLGCSEHTVKNVIYEIMARLQVRNRSHAVAHAVRHGLV